MTGTITFKGEFTINTLSEEMDRLKDAVKKWDELTVDMGGTKKVDAAAVQMLVAARKECERIGHRMVFRMSDGVKAILQSLGLQL